MSLQIFAALAAIGIGYAVSKAIRQQRSGKKRVLVVVTSHSDLGSTGKKTGFWLEEFAVPYYVLKDSGFDITVASPKGGVAPIDPKSDDASSETEITKRFRSEPESMKMITTTKKLGEMDEKSFDAIFFPGGHGPMWDLAEDPNSKALIEKFFLHKKPIAAVCHGPAVFKHTASVIKGRSLTGFSNAEEVAVELDKVVPFSLEDVLKQHGGNYKCGPNWAPYVIVDSKSNQSLLITGQNPASSEGVAMELVKALRG